MKRIAPLFSQNKTVLRNLRLAFPDLSEEDRAKIAESAWESVGRTAGELPHLPSINPYKGDRVEVVGAEYLDTVESNEEGAVFISGHFANWEVMAAVICQRPVDCLVTYRALNNPHIDRRLNKVRHDYGIGVLTPKGLGTRELMRALSKGRTVALLNDQKFNQGLPIRFFGHDAMTAPGPSRLALKYGVPIVPVTTRSSKLRLQLIPGNGSGSIGDGPKKPGATQVSWMPLSNHSKHPIVFQVRRCGDRYATLY